MRFEKSTIQILTNALRQLEQGFDHLPQVTQSYDLPGITKVLQAVAHEMQSRCASRLYVIALD
jgi:hypothetical protein